MDGDGATDSTAHMYSNMADFLTNDVKATPTAMGLLDDDVPFCHHFCLCLVHCQVDTNAFKH